MAKGGDGYTVFTKGKIIDDNQDMPDALYQNFKNVFDIDLPSIDRQIDLSKITSATR